MSAESNPPRIMNRLSQTAYAALEKETRGLVGQVPKNGDEALILAGVELVLRKLRIGYTIEGV